MHNLIKIDLQSGIDDVIQFKHNGQWLVDLVPGQNIISIEFCNAENSIEICNQSKKTITVLDVTMFDIGSKKLVYLGMIRSNNDHYQSQDIPSGHIWHLVYKFPVFSWLHDVCNLGWKFKS